MFFDNNMPNYDNVTGQHEKLINALTHLSILSSVSRKGEKRLYLIFETITVASMHKKSAKNSLSN